MTARTRRERADLLLPLSELFRTYGYEATSLARIEQATGLGKGSLYHFFPGGKEEMLRAVLQEVQGWFEQHVFTPLERSADARSAIAAMFDAVRSYFRAGRRVCLLGALSLTDSRDPFAQEIARYFVRWRDALARALRKLARPRKRALAQAEDALVAVQGALVLARALDRPELFQAAVTRAQQSLLGGS